MTAAIEAGTTRLRPVLMTALAMILGMLPMSLALGAGGGENAPLGRAVIGGLIAATFMTLLVIPIVYSFVGGTRISKLQRDAQMRRTGSRPKPRKKRRCRNSMAERTSTTSSSGAAFYLKWIAIPLVAIDRGSRNCARARPFASQSANDLAEGSSARAYRSMHGTAWRDGRAHGHSAGRGPWLLRDTDLRKNFRLRERHVRGQGLGGECGSELVATIVSPETDQQVRNAKATYDLAKITDDRYQTLVKNAVVPQQTADTTSSNHACRSGELEIAGCHSAVRTCLCAVRRDDHRAQSVPGCARRHGLPPQVHRIRASMR